MELSELRQRWQQTLPPPATPDFTENVLRQLLNSRSGSPVFQMARNMRLEIGFTALVAISSAAALLVVEDAYWRSWLGMMLLICALAVPYYIKKSRIIRELAEPQGTVQEHVRRQVDSLRALMQLYYKLTMWSIPLWLGVGLYFTGQQMGQQIQGPKVWIGLSILVGFYLLLGTVMYFTMKSFTSWYLQKLYGQHLDRLEQSLAELEEPVTQN